jgi:hypothetical protein
MFLPHVLAYVLTVDLPALIKGKNLVRRPEPVFSEDDLSTLIKFVRASSIKPEGEPFDLTTRPYLHHHYDESRENYRPRIVIMKAAQMGLTVKLFYRAAWLVGDARKKINTALMFPSKDEVFDLHKSRFRPMMHASPKMMTLIKDVDAVNIVRIGSSNLRFRGMRTGIGMDSFPADALLFDEVRLMSVAAIERAFIRISESKLETASGQRGIIELNSTAGFPGMDIDLWFSRSTMNYWRTPCPNPGCKNHEWGIAMPLRWPDIVGQKGSELYYKCPDCDTPITDDHIHHTGFYVPEQPKADWEGYQFSQILKGNRFLPELWAAYNRGDNLPEFYNSRLGLPYKDPDAVPATKEVVESCIDDSLEYRWPEPETLTGEWVSMGVDQRGVEKHCVIKKLGRGGTWDLVHLHVLEASGNEAAKAIVKLALFWGVKILVMDGEPSYDLAVEVARLLPKKVVWLADYAANQAQPVQFIDDRDKETIKKTSGEIKYEFRVLMDRYKALDWSLTSFARKRVRLPSDLYAKTQLRRMNGVLQNVPVAKEFVTHLENMARATIPETRKLPTGETVMTGEVRQIYRYLAMDPHYAHANLYADAGLQYGQDGGTIFHIEEPGVAKLDLNNQLNNIMPKGLKPADLAREKQQALEYTCGNCRYMKTLTETKHLCGHPSNAGMKLNVTPDTPKCQVWRRK